MIAFVPLDEKALPQVLAWRCDPDVSRYLFTDVDDNLEQQRHWFRQVSSDPRCLHWLIHCQEKSIGLAYLSDIDFDNLRCSCGFYIGEPRFRRFGGLILPGIVNYVFGQLAFHKIYGEVMEGNNNVLKLHEIHGYRLVGIQQEHIFKYGRWHDVHLFELHRSHWEAMKGHYRQFRIPVLEKGIESCTS